ncbi:MAG: arsenic resistance protein [Pseudomonadota bacterium]
MLTKLLHKTGDFMSGQGAAFLLISAIICGSAIGIRVPQLADQLPINIDVTILLLVFLVLFDVRIQSILSSLNRVAFIIVALLINFVIIPALGFGIAYIFLNNHPLFCIGLVIYFMAPCTDWFLAFTRLAKGNTALGAALLPVNMIVQLLLYPVYLHIFGIDAIGTDTSSIFNTLRQWFLIPLLIAVAGRLVCERVLREQQFAVLQSLVSTAIPLLLALLVWQLTVTNIITLLSHTAVFPLILAGIILFFVVTYFLSEAISKLMKLPYEDRVLLTMTTSARNAPLMLALTVTVVPDQPIIYAAIITGMLIELPHLIALKSVLMLKRNQIEFNCSAPQATSI